MRVENFFKIELFLKKVFLPLLCNSFYLFIFNLFLSMSNFLSIQPAIFCEPCKDCGARPVVEQIKGKFIVKCPNNKNHYRTKPGLVDIQDWNLKNKVHTPFLNIPAQQAS
jgi:hypothetical protein